MDPNDADENDDGNFPGSARVPRAGDGVAPPRTFPDAKPAEDALYFRRRLPHFESVGNLRSDDRNEIEALLITGGTHDCLECIAAFPQHTLRAVRRLRDA
jgi:hypothetical protein